VAAKVTGPEPALGKRAARGAAVTLGAQGARILIQVASVVVLARLLTPQDYGLIAMVVAVIGIGEIFRDFGLSSAAIQSPTLSTGQRDNLFWINTGIGLVLAGAVFGGAGLLAIVYDHDELVGIAHVLSLTFVLTGLTTQYRASLVRDLRFAALARADVASPAVALVVSIAAALLGWGYWALITGQLAQALSQLVMLAVSARWLPGLPKRGEPMRGFMRFGWNLVGSQLVGYISNNIDSVIIGRQFGAGPLGIYNRAFQLLMTPLSQIRSPLTTVALPVLSRLVDDDKRFGDYIARGQLALGYSLVAGLGVAVGAAEPITRIFLGEQWTGVSPILRLLAVAGIFQTLAFVGYWVYVARGLTGDLFRYSLVSATIKLACIVAGSAFGVIGIAAGYAIAPALSWPISLWWLSRRTTIPTRRLYLGALRVLAVVTVSAAAAAGRTLLADNRGSPAQLGLALLGAVAVYALAAWLVRPVRDDLLRVLEMVRMIRTARTAR
jgi:O-antigen/teichoic acid export membrane protein